MSTNLRSDVRAQLGWTWRDHADAAPVTDSNRLQFRKDLGDGIGTDQAEAVWHTEDQTLGDGSSTTLDLAALEQSLFGNTLTIALAGVRAILIVNRDASQGSLLIGGAAADTWHAPFGAAEHRVRVMPGGALLLAHPGRGWAVGPGETDLKIEASGGAATYDIAILGTTTTSSSSSGV